MAAAPMFPRCFCVKAMLVAVRDGSRSLEYFKALGDLADARTSPSWLNRDTTQLSGAIQRLPERAEIDGSLERTADRRILLTVVVGFACAGWIFHR